MSAPSLHEMLARLIAIPSVSSVNPTFDQGNRVLIDEVAGWMEAAGFAVEIVPIPGKPDKANVIGTLGQGPGGLVLAGHTDTVPCDEHLWTHDPFRLTEDDGRLYGLGTSDMKSFIALALEAARGLRAADLEQPLIILATADEESSMAGAETLVKLGRPKARYAVIGEPTGLRPVRMHKGVMMEAIRITGHSGHSSDPSLGANAIEGMQQAMGALLEFRTELQSCHCNPLFHVPVPTMNFGYIHGGDNPNRICGHCELHIDVRPLPGMNMLELRDMLKERLGQAVTIPGLSLAVEPLFAGTPPMETPADSPLVRATEALTGHAAEAVPFGTEGPYLRELGMDVVVLGPGDIAQAHQPDEYLALDRIPPTLDLLRALIQRFCLQPQSG
ncbi:MAG TPA: acetylornithine deacetylase [Chromatiales bacterium]|nr:acetylornithine deacetylase [Chromatiales bacterium]